MDRFTPGLIALVLGGFLALLLAIPYLAIVYRRRGELGFGFAVLSFLTVVYAFALVCYATLPLPLSDAAALCASPAQPQLRLGASIDDILREGVGSPGALLRNSAFLQVALNILFFLPLGMLVRHLFKRGFLLTVLIGFGVSLFIELTQLTGNWFLYPCAYRLFDVDDLVVNTAGALLGAVLAPLLRLIPGQTPRGDGEQPRRVTAGRRLLGMLLDVLAAILISAIVLVGQRVFVLLIGREDLLGSGEGPLAQAIANGVGIGVPLLVVLLSGRTLGEIVVRLAPARRPGLLRRLLRWLAGIGGYQLLTLTEFPFSGLVVALFVLLSGLLLFTTREHRGLAYLLSRQELRDERAAVNTAVVPDARSRPSTRA